MKYKLVEHELEYDGVATVDKAIFTLPCLSLKDAYDPNVILQNVVELQKDKDFCKASWVDPENNTRVFDTYELTDGKISLMHHVRSHGRFGSVMLYCYPETEEEMSYLLKSYEIDPGILMIDNKRVLSSIDTNQYSDDSRGHIAIGYTELTGIDLREYSLDRHISIMASNEILSKSPVLNIRLPQNIIGIFIGKGGSHIKEVIKDMNEHGFNIKRISVSELPQDK